MKSTYILPLELESALRVGQQTLDRTAFFAWAWKELAKLGLLGVHEGTMLSEAAAEQGLETESWTVDAGLAPRERDWVSGQELVQAELYFEELTGAEKAAERLKGIGGLKPGTPREVPARDWDAEWKADFLARARGLVIPPGWHVLPPWASDEEGAVAPGERVIRINPGAGFGTGTHETTQLCLGALADVVRAPIARALDFGSGSGILAVALGMLGVREIDAVEIDTLAIENAEENARLNHISQIRFSTNLFDGPYDLIVANILRPVLLEFRESLVARLKGPLVLSGLIDRDVEEVRRAYSASLGRDCEVRTLGEWRCLVFS